jgi:hypothetical protein
MNSAIDPDLVWYSRSAIISQEEIIDVFEEVE